MKLGFMLCFLFVILTLFPALFTLCFGNLRSFDEKWRISQIYEASQPDLTQVDYIYCNLYVLEKNNSYSTCVTFTLAGSEKEIGWLVLTSPYKPLLIVSSNWQMPFVELTYDKPNPIESTTHQYAWDYDFANQTVYIKLLLTTADTTANVRVVVYYTISAQIIELVGSKSSYTMNEHVDLSLTVRGMYILPLTINWMIRIVVTDSTGKLLQTASKEVELEQNQTKTLQYKFGPFSSEDVYNATAQIIDPSITPNTVLDTYVFTFQVSGGTPPGLFGLSIPNWAKIASILIVIFVVCALIIRSFKKRRKASQKSGSPHHS